MISTKKKYDESIKETLDSQDWESILPPVLKYAVAQSTKYSWLGNKIDPETLLLESVARAYGVGENGTYRNWNREKCPELKDFLIGIIRSITSHNVMRCKNFPEDSLYTEDGKEKDFEVRKGLIAKTDSFISKTPEQLYIEYEQLDILVEKLKDIAEVDEELEILICLEAGIAKPREIVKETGYDIKEVNKILNRLRIQLRKNLKIQNFSSKRKVGTNA